MNDNKSQTTSILRRQKIKLYFALASFSWTLTFLMSYITLTKPWFSQFLAESTVSLSVIHFVLLIVGNLVLVIGYIRYSKDH